MAAATPSAPAPEPADPAIAGRIGTPAGAARLRSLADPDTLRELVGNLKEGVYVTNLQGEILDANRSFLNMMGVATLAELAAMNAFELFVDPEQRVRELDLLRREGAVREFEIEIKRRDGTHRTVIDSCTAVRESGSDEVLFHGVLVDITDRKIAERERTESETNFRALIEQSAEAIYVLQDDRFVLVNPAWERLFGWTQMDVIRPGFDFYKVIAPQSHTMIRERVARIDRGEEQPPRFDLTGLTRDGHMIDLVCNVADILWRGRPATQGIYHDVTDLKRNAAHLSRTLSLLSTTLESTADGILVVDDGGRIETCNRKFLEMWRLPEDVVASADHDHLLSLMAEQLRDGDATLRRVTELQANPEAESYDEIEFRDGRVFERYSIPQRQGFTVLGRVWSFRDVTARKTAEMRLVHDAFHDALTNLPNRALFTDLLARCIGRSKRRDDYAFALLFLDIDRFKVVNDSLGHLIGDQLLIAIARRLERCLRPGDTVARLGGDEFTVLLDDITDVSDATRIADRIQRELNLPFTLSGQEVFTSASIGIALSRTGYDRPDDLLRDADIAMYRAKALGKQRYEVFDAEMHARAVTQLQLETDLRRALDREEFRIHYQPIFSLLTGKVTGFEALVRWQHPQRGMVLPDEFVQVAEETGLIVTIGRAVLREACRQLREWQVQYPQHELTMSVNLSAKQFRQPDLVDHIARVLTAWDLAPSSLRLEITESAIIENAQTAVEALTRLRTLGVLVDLDDFGTGYSSLSYLHRFDLDALKIDRSFIARIGAAGENSEIVRTIVNLARGLDMDVVAEGVERPEQLAILRSLGCEKVQGYLFSPPLATEAVRSLLKARE
jgi:diguanylate cyclase (GGDEF)-like protein/PAS domain S-box-containing protein